MAFKNATSLIEKNEVIQKLYTTWMQLPGMSLSQLLKTACKNKNIENISDYELIFLIDKYLDDTYNKLKKIREAK
jgi:hypothetical protein